MIEWLKTSIPGIVILGAIGSLIATFLWKFFAWLLSRVLPESARKIMIFEYRDAFRRGYIRAWQQTEQKPYETVVYFAYALARLSGSLTLTVCFLVLSCVYLTTKEVNAVVSILGLASVTLLFLSGYWCWRHFRPIREAFNEVVMPIIKGHDDMISPPKESKNGKDESPNDAESDE